MQHEIVIYPPGCLWFLQLWPCVRWFLLVYVADQITRKALSRLIEPQFGRTSDETDAVECDECGAGPIGRMVGLGAVPRRRVSAKGLAACPER